ncbi:MAG: hypothetical protein AT715_06255 [Thermoproteus sp. JCHS_4]|nr:MAG: hypothetical protein AT715_06255 [Thermoproteus sp. JCHS_4]
MRRAAAGIRTRDRPATGRRPDARRINSIFAFALLPRRVGSTCTSLLSRLGSACASRRRVPSRARPPIILRPEGLMGMEGGKEKRKIALEILNEADKIVRLAKMLADEDDSFARRGLYAFLDAEMKALRALVYDLVFSPE